MVVLSGPSPPTETSRPPASASPAPPRASGTGGRAFHRPVAGVYSSNVARFESTPQRLPPSTYTRPPAPIAARCSRGDGPEVVDHVPVARSSTNAVSASPVGVTPPTTMSFPSTIAAAPATLRHRREREAAEKRDRSLE